MYCFRMSCKTNSETMYKTVLRCVINYQESDTNISTKSERTNL